MPVVGIDIGGSTTKIIGVDQGVPMPPMQVSAEDPLTSVYGAFGKYISENRLEIRDISKITVTGVGASFIKEDIYGIPTCHVSEFNAIGFGGLYLSGLDNAIIVSMGTGTAFVPGEFFELEKGRRRTQGESEGNPQSRPARRRIAPRAASSLPAGPDRLLRQRTGCGRS